MKLKLVLLIVLLTMSGVLLYSNRNLTSQYKNDTKRFANVALTPFPVNYAPENIDHDAVTLVKNSHHFFPFTTSDVNGLVLVVGNHTYSFTSMMSNLTNTQILQFDNLEEAARQVKRRKGLSRVLLSIHFDKNDLKTLGRMEDELEDFMNEVPESVSTGIVVFGSPYVLRNPKLLAAFDAVVFAYKNDDLLQNRTAQVICGALPMNGKLLYEINQNLKLGEGIHYRAIDRLCFINPSEMGINNHQFVKLDTFLLNAINDGVFPGCQVAFAYKGKVIYDKSFGKLSYDDSEMVDNTDIYDLASLTKVLASTPSLMVLQSKGKFNLDKKLSDYLPELVNGTYDQDITLRSLMAHQAGFIPYFPFYKKTIKNNVLDSTIYHLSKTSYYNRQVADNIWINSHFRDTMMNEILHRKLETPGRYKYSDVGYYFVERIIEKLSRNTEDQFVEKEIYSKLGLNRTGYNPLSYYPLSKIAPTENDKTFRHQLVRGYVHDQGAALMGGVAGHAGLFSNATDILAILQMYLNKGKYAGHQIIKPEVVEEFTKQQFPGNRRAAGFDRPDNVSKTWPVSEYASAESFGHSGFTGTFVWVDPVKQLAFVFLSNRINPDAENPKMVQQRIRVNAHRMVYELLPKE